MNTAEIQNLGLQIVALGKVAEELSRKQAKLVKKSAKPAPRVRTDRRKERMEKIAKYYLKKGIV